MRISSQELRRAARTLTRRPGFTVVAVLTIALAIALNTVMFSVLDALINPRVDMRNPGQLYWVRYFGDYRQRLTFDMKEAALRAGLSQVFQAIATYEPGSPWAPTLVEHNHRFFEAAVARVSSNFFAVTGAHPREGRVFSPADSTENTQAVVISERLEKQLFAGESTAIGQTLTLDGKGLIVVGVLGRASDFPNANTDAWRIGTPEGPYRVLPQCVVRLRDGVTPEQAERQFAVLSARLAIAAGDSPRDSRFDIARAAQPQFRASGFHYALITSVVAVLLVACANVANLQLARGLSRARELATRAAIGASRSDLIAHLLTESALIAAAGLTLGLVLTLWGIGVVGAAVPPSVGQYIVEPQTSWRMFAFAMFAACVCLVLVGLLPALRVSKVDLNDVLKSGAGTGSTKRGRRQSGALVVLEVGLALSLLSGAMLLVRSDRQMRHKSYGFDTRAIVYGLAAVAREPGKRISQAARARQVVAQLRQLPNVAAAAVRYSGWLAHDTVSADDPSGTPVQVPMPLYSVSVVTPAYLKTFRIPIVRGRDFEEGEEGAPSVIVDEAMAHFLWPNSNAVGRQLKLGSAAAPGAWVRVVGVSRTALFWGDLLTEQEMAFKQMKGGQIFVLNGRDTMPMGKEGVALWVVARGRTSAATLPIDIRRELQTLSWVRLSRMQTYDEWVGDKAKRENHDFVAAMFALFASLGVGLAAIGVYAVAAHTVAQRTREFGVRIALGASGGRLLARVLRENSLLALAGIAVGLLLTAWSVRLVGEFLFFQEDVYDSTFFALAGLVLYLAAALAALVPALRASRVNPVEALRSD